MTNKELTQWLRNNSSGVYRPAALAADVIEELEKKNSTVRGALFNLLEQVYQMREMFDDSDGTIASAVEDAEEALGSTEDES